ncbi:MAG: hypothetical protein ACQEQC_07455 [Elusimicrobiota bacterium]
MNFVLKITPSAKEQLKELKNDKGLKKRKKAVDKALKFLKNNPGHPSLQTHKYETLEGPKGEPVFEAYAEQNTPAAYHIFFYYGSNKNEITIIAITPHP